MRGRDIWLSLLPRHSQMCACCICCTNSPTPQPPCCSSRPAQGSNRIPSLPCCLPSQGIPPAERIWKQLLVLRTMFGSLLPFLIGFPPPVLEIEELYPLAGTDINVTCSRHVLTSPSPTLWLQGAPDLPALGKPAWLSLTTKEEDDGRNFSCEASLEVQGQRLMRNTAVQLHVLCE